MLRKISNLIQANWNSETTGLQVSDIAWSHDKYETLTSVEQVNQKAIVRHITRQTRCRLRFCPLQTRFFHEIVVVDVVLHTAILGGTDACIGFREAVRLLILQILHANQALLPGANLMVVEGEYVRGELPQIQREAFKVCLALS